MSDGRRLVNAMMAAGRQNPSHFADIVVGDVISIDPLKIKVDKLELTEAFLVVGALCKYKAVSTNHLHTIQAQSTDQGGEDDHTHNIPVTTTDAALPTVILWRGLQVGDTVYLLRFAQGQKYFVLQRLEGV